FGGIRGGVEPIEHFRLRVKVEQRVIRSGRLLDQAGHRVRRWDLPPFEQRGLERRHGGGTRRGRVLIGPSEQPLRLRYCLIALLLTHSLAGSSHQHALPSPYST